MSATRILIADDHAVVRSGLRLILGGEPGFELVGEAATGEEAVREASRLRPDILVLDIAMPGMNGLEAARLVRRDAPETRIVILTMHDDEGYLKEFLAAGVDGYVLKQAADTDLVQAIRAVQRGESFIDPAMTRHLIDIFLKQSHPAPPTPALPDAELSPRETEVVRLVALGYSGQQIADQLSISASTVETHRAHVMEKLKLHGRAQLVRYALSKGLLDEAPP